MTKSQNTKNEQQKDLCITSEQLTEQWKKRTLRNGAYYIKMLDGDILPAFCNTEYILKQFQTMKGIYDNVAEVLAPVPSYEEWKASYNCMLENEVLRLKNAQLKEQINHLSKTQARQFVDNQKLQVKAEKAKDVVNIDTARQIKQLKEVLKQSRIYVKIETEDYDDRTVSKAEKSEAKELLIKIDEVLR